MRGIDIIEGGVSLLLRSDVDTDQIIPKQFLKRIDKTGYGEFLFYDWIQSGEIEINPNPILISGKNFGSGSSREHAVWALKDFGFEAIIAESFSDIFRQNALENGLLLIDLSKETIDLIRDAPEMRIDLDEGTINTEDGVVFFETEENTKHRLLHGLDPIEITLQDEDMIATFEEKHLLGLPKIR